MLFLFSFEEALRDYKKVQELKPGNKKVEADVRNLCCPPLFPAPLPFRSALRLVVPAPGLANEYLLVDSAHG